MERRRGRRVFVHCAADYALRRSSCCLRVLRLGWRINDALPDIRAIWNPAGYPAWQAFIEASLAARPEARP